VSEGVAADMLQAMCEPGLTVLPFQEFSSLPDVLASGDALVTILEPEASTYSVPSKTLTYLCAGRPVVALLPASNPAYAVVRDSGGLPLDLSSLDISAAAATVAELLSDDADLNRRGQRARSYAEANFDIQDIGDRFERVLTHAARHPTSSTRPAVDHVAGQQASVRDAAGVGRP
jgi:glycosyltransferase involved in cell wall biosynthesis